MSFAFFFRFRFILIYLIPASNDFCRSPRYPGGTSLVCICVCAQKRARLSRSNGDKSLTEVNKGGTSTLAIDGTTAFIAPSCKPCCMLREECSGIFSSVRKHGRVSVKRDVDYPENGTRRCPKEPSKLREMTDRPCGGCLWSAHMYTSA